ncbi:MAG: hypothetical protein VYA34_15530 [Myxococcota bacterium]|nr:hypothetical protein [Myxococcota bacterium]
MNKLKNVLIRMTHDCGSEFKTVSVGIQRCQSMRPTSASILRGPELRVPANFELITTEETKTQCG